MSRSTGLRRSRGFSLLELLIVMAILAILALASAPWFAKISQRNQVKSAGQELSITFAAARMRAVKRNRPARVLITRPTAFDNFNRIETFEEVVPTPIKVGESRITSLISFPTAGTQYPQPSPLQVIFGPDGRLTGTPGDQTFTLRGVMNAPLTNDLPVQIATSGRIRVLGPNPILPLKPEGTGWR